MANNAQANWNVVHVQYGSGDKDVSTEDKERTCLCHWTLCLQRVTFKLIKLEFQQQYKELCKQCKDAKTQEEAKTRYNIIRGWWVSSGATTEVSRRVLNNWMAFWHFQYMQLVSNYYTSLNSTFQ